MMTIKQFEQMKEVYQAILVLFAMIIILSIGAGLITSSLKSFRDVGIGIVVVTSLAAGVAVYKFGSSFFKTDTEENKSEE